MARMQVFVFYGVFIMVRGGKKSSESAQGNNATLHNPARTTVQWVNPKPNSIDIDWLEGQSDHYIDQITFLVDELSDEQRLSLKRDGYSGRWLAVLFDDSHAQDGIVHALSVRGATAFAAIVLLHYFHHVKFKEGWFDYVDKDTDMFG